MCSRFRGISDYGQLPRHLQWPGLPNFESNANVAPTEAVPVFLTENDSHAARLGRFGIVRPGPGGKPRPPLLNNRTDTLMKGSFKSLLAHKRCIIPAQGFYEWREESGKKQPYYFYRTDGKPILFVGLWDYSVIKGDRVTTFSILTDEPNELVAPYHDRMPVIVDDGAAWLDLDGKGLQTIIPLPLDAYAAKPMNPAMNKPGEKNLAVIEAEIPVKSENWLFPEGG